MPFTMLDGILIFVMLVSAVLAMIRGFTREVFAIGSWVAAAAATYFFWEPLLPYTQRYIEDQNIALGVTIAGIFFITLLAASLVTMRLSDFVLDSRAGPLDRTLGFLFGAARGLILVVVAFLFLNFFIAEQRQPEWITQAATRPWLQDLGNGLMNSLPDDPEAEILERLRGPDQAATPPSGEEADQEMVPGPADLDAAPEPPPDYATDDQNQLEREIETPPE